MVNIEITKEFSILKSASSIDDDYEDNLRWLLKKAVRKFFWRFAGKQLCWSPF